MRTNGNGADGNGDGYPADGHPSEGYVGPRAHPYDYLVTLARYRAMIISVVVAATVGVGIYTLVMPQTYVATAVLLPPDKSQGPSLSSLLAGGASGGLDLASFGENPSAEVFVKILTSRTLGDSLVTRFKVAEEEGLDSTNRLNAVWGVLGGFDVSSERSGMINVTYRARTGYMPSDAEKRKTAEKAAAYANAAVEILDQLNRQKIMTRARRSREYIGRMLELKRRELDTAQMALLAFQTNNRAIDLDRQVEASVNALAEVQSQIQKKELELGAALNELTPDARMVENLRSQVAQLKSQRSRVESGASGSEALSIPLRSLPDLGRQYANLKLNLEVATQVYTFLEAQYNQEQVQEARDLPTVSVLDGAVAPLERSAPRRGLIVAVTFVAALIFSTFLAFLIDLARRRWRPADEVRSRALREALGSTKERRTSTIS